MTPVQVEQWLVDLKTNGVAKTAKEAAALLGVTEKTMSQMKLNGVKGDAADRTALAMSAVLARLPPYAA